MLLIVCELTLAKPNLLVIDSTPASPSNKRKANRKAIDLTDYVARFQTWFGDFMSFSDKNFMKIQNEEQTKKLYYKLIEAQNGCVIRKEV